MKKVFLDTNIVIDFLGERVGFYEPSARILTLADEKKITIYTSPTSIANSYYILSRIESPRVVLEKMRKFKVLCHISIINDEVIEKAINSEFKDFEDSIQYFSALESNCDVIITRNEKDFKHAFIPVLNSEDYLEAFSMM